MYWNYRMLQAKDEYGDLCTSIVEVYYAEDGTLQGYTSPARVLAGSAEELQEVLNMMEAALGKPVLTPEDFGGRNESTDVETW